MLIKLLNEDTEKRLSNILLSATSENKLLDIKDIINCIRIINEYDNVTDYLTVLKESKTKKSLAGYSYHNKSMYIDIDYVKSQDMDILKKNSMLLNALLHEISHVYQHKYVDNNDDIRSKLLNASFDITRTESREVILNKYKSIELYNIYKKACYKIVYSAIYSTIPSERLAIYDSNKEVNNILKIAFNNNANNIIAENNIETFKALSMNIINDIKINSPLKVFLSIHDNMPFFEPVNKYIDSDSLDLEEKFVYGFSLSKNEFKKVKLNYFYPEFM